MVEISAHFGPGSLVPAGKEFVARSMYGRGRAFIAAALLLRREQRGEPAEWVELHLLCQGIECVLKGILLAADYDKYEQLLPKKKLFGHDICRTANEVCSVFRLNSMNPAITNELNTLNDWYAKNFMRYAGVSDVFISPRSIQRDRVFQRLYQAMRLIERKWR